MRSRYLLPLLLLASAASAPALAQRASLADRVATLEARANNNQANVDLLNQVSQLRSEIQALRAQVEELQQQNQQLQSTSKAQYLDMDDRLNRLEGGGPLAPAPSAAEPAASAKPAMQGPVENTPAVYGDKGAITQGAGERAVYDAAFNALKAGQYVQSAELFQDFLQQHPNGNYTPNALYWLGESYYVTQNYQLAQEQFQALLERYPTHDKAVGALLKIGLSQYGAREYDAAERTLSEVTTRYPGTDAARTAADRLSAIQLGHLTR